MSDGITEARKSLRQLTPGEALEETRELRSPYLLSPGDVVKDPNTGKLHIVKIFGLEVTTMVSGEVVDSRHLELVQKAAASIPVPSRSDKFRDDLDFILRTFWNHHTGVWDNSVFSDSDIRKRMHGIVRDYEKRNKP